MSSGVNQVGGVQAATQTQQQALQEARGTALQTLRDGPQPTKPGQYAFVHAEDSSSTGDVSVFGARGSKEALPGDQFKTLIDKAADQVLGKGSHSLSKKQLDDNLDDSQTAQFMQDLVNQGVLTVPDGFACNAQSLNQAWGGGSENILLEGRNDDLASALKAAMKAPYMQGALAQIGAGTGVAKGPNAQVNAVTGNLRPNDSGLLI